MADAFTWTWDAPDGVYKNHAISGKLLMQAALGFKFVQFTDLVPGFGKGKGEKVTSFHYQALSIPTNLGRLAEDSRVPIDKLTMGSRELQVYQFGRGAEYTHLQEQLGVFAPRSSIQKALIEQMRTCLDQSAAAGFKAAKIKFIPTSLTGGTWDTDGTASTPATKNLTADHLGVIRDYLANDLHAPFYEGDCYMGLFATKPLRGIKSDRRFERWYQYLRKGDLIFNSEVGQCESIRLVEVNMEGSLSNSIGTGSCTGEGVVFGSEAVSRAEVEAPHLRADPNFQANFGLIKAVMWFGILGFGPTWNTANDREARIIHIASS